jgi:hypothetical protein
MVPHVTIVICVSEHDILASSYDYLVTSLAKIKYALELVIHLINLKVNNYSSLYGETILGPSQIVCLVVAATQIEARFTRGGIK